MAQLNKGGLKSSLKTVTTTKTTTTKTTSSATSTVAASTAKAQSTLTYNAARAADVQRRRTVERARIQGLITAKNSDIASLQDQITRLKTARDNLLWRSADVDEFKRILDLYDPGVSWQGTKRDDFDEGKAEQVVYLQNYSNEIMNHRQDIIDLLKQKQAALTDLQAELNSLQLQYSNVDKYIV